MFFKALIVSFRVVSAKVDPSALTTRPGGFGHQQAHGKHILAVSLPERSLVSSVIQKFPFREESTSRSSSLQYHLSLVLSIVVTFIPMMLLLLLNFLRIPQASSVLPLFASADPIINILSSLIILSYTKIVSDAFEDIYNFIDRFRLGSDKFFS